MSLTLAGQTLLYRGLLFVLFSMLCMGHAQAAKYDVRLVIDVSGSMKKNDPTNLRQPALELLVKLLPQDSVAGIWTFGQRVNKIVAHQKVDQSWRDKAMKSAKRIGSSAQFTNIGGALEKVAFDLAKPNPDRSTHVILLTDGMVDIDQDPEVNQQEWRRIVDQVLPGYQQADYKLHTIALSPNADRALMSKLALETGGSAAVAETSQELMSNFLSIFDQAVPSEQLPLSDNQFLTDSSIEEFTALIFREVATDETVLVSPANKEYRKSTVDPNLSWYHTPEYDLITIKRPVEGQWQVRAKLKPQSRITIVSDLSLVVEPMANALSPSDDLQLSLRLEEDGKTVTRAEFLELLEIVYELKNTTKDEEPWEGSLSDGLVPGNGIYSSRLGKLSDIGDYQLTIAVDGKTFKRQYVHRFSIKSPFDITLTPYSDQQGVYYSALVTSNTPGLNVAKTEVVGKLKDPSGSSIILPFILNNLDQWVLKIRPEQKGDYQLAVRITTVDRKGDRADVVPDIITFSYPTKDAVAEAIDDSAEPTEVSGSVDSNFVTGEEELEPVEEELLEEEEGFPKWILYTVLGVVNLFIIIVAFVLYRMFRKNNDDDDPDLLEETDSNPDGFEMTSDSLPPMDSMEEDLMEPDFDEPSLEEVDIDEDIDLSEPLSEQADIDASTDTPSEEPKPVDEEPEFSLDDFAPDALDDNEFEEEPKKDD